FAARTDDQVSLKQLHKAFESTLETIVKQTIPSRTYDRIFKRFDTFWPDWQNDEKANQWLVQYTLRRLSHARQPLALSDLRSLKNKLSHDQLNRLLTYLISPQSRTAIAYIGK
ncbi:MAG: hypothetical protein OIF54_02905, partial [Cohaesibacter sp.]|nr:hypothetical protein [Cohaesibacter sp.]